MKALKEIIEDNLATKRDLEDLKKDLTIRMEVCGFCKYSKHSSNGVKQGPLEIG